MTSEECARCVPGLLKQVRLHGELADKPAGRFSGGMQRRLSVACAFIGNPIGSAKGDRKVVMLDEPTTVSGSSSFSIYVVPYAHLCSNPLLSLQLSSSTSLSPR